MRWAVLEGFHLHGFGCCGLMSSNYISQYMASMRIQCNITCDSWLLMYRWGKWMQYTKMSATFPLYHDVCFWCSLCNDGATGCGASHASHLTSNTLPVFSHSLFHT